MIRTEQVAFLRDLATRLARDKPPTLRDVERLGNVADAIAKEMILPEYPEDRFQCT